MNKFRNFFSIRALVYYELPYYVIIIIIIIIFIWLYIYSKVRDDEKNSDRELHGETEKRYWRDPLETPSAVKSPPSRCSEEEE